MKKINQNSAKSSSAIVNPIAKKDESPNLSKINLSKFADQLEKMELKEKKDKETIYIYPEGMSKSDISGEKGKKFRNGLRNKMKFHSNNILLFAKKNRLDDLKSAIESFRKFYKENYRINDLSIKSISHSANEEKNIFLSLFLEIVKESKF